MTYNISDIIGLIVRLFFLLTPFCTLSLFLTFGGDLDPKEQRRFAIRISFAIFCCCAVFYLFGGVIFKFLGITLDAFRIGAGLVLLLNGIDLVRGSGIPQGRSCDGVDPGDLAHLRHGRQMHRETHFPVARRVVTLPDDFVLAADEVLRFCVVSSCLCS